MDRTQLNENAFDNSGLEQSLPLTVGNGCKMHEELDSKPDSPKEACGVVGICGASQVSYKAFMALRAIQHRGQESAGIATFHERITSHKRMGLVHDAITTDNLAMLIGNTGIGHVRYSTAGSSTIENAQPVVATTSFGDIALAHNGEITNTEELKNKLHAKGWAFITTSDSEVIIRVLAAELHNSRGDVVEALKALMRQLCGSYSLVLLVGERVFAIRDALGIKPLCYGRYDDGFVVASESCALDALDCMFERDLDPGEILELLHNNVISHQTGLSTRKAHCMFEWVYFARADSVIDGRLVNDVRFHLGEILAREHPVDADLVVPVPDSGRTHAMGYANESGITYMEGLMKNRYIWRTFIMPEKEDRHLNVRLKLNPIRSLVEEKRVILVDDSIVRGTTMTRLVKLLRDYGASEVHVRIGCPPIISPCYLGIDMKTFDQFIAVGRDFQTIANMVGADSVGYASIDGLIEAIRKPKADLCLGCLNGEYPVQKCE